MRYYKITLTPPAGSALLPVVFSTINDQGNYVAGALQIDLDIIQAAYGTAQSGSYVRIWGIGLDYISDKYNFNDWDIEVRIGMSHGLPLANPNQQGVALTGKVFEAFGTWEGTSQYFDIVMYPDSGSTGSPKNISFDWKAGTPLAQACQVSLQDAFPDMVIDVSKISPNLVLPNDQPGFYQSLKQIANYLGVVSKSIGPTTATRRPYSGVNIYVSGNSIIAMDNSGPITNPKQIKFTDLIGQPAWRGLNTINFNVVMRGDLQIGDFISLPPTIITSQPQTGARLRQNSVFTGLCQIAGDQACIRHVGSSRQPQGQAWMTTVFATVLNPA